MIVNDKILKIAGCAWTDWHKMGCEARKRGHCPAMAVGLRAENDDDANSGSRNQKSLPLF